jgi:hypothetical protein
MVAVAVAVLLATSGTGFGASEEAPDLVWRLMGVSGDDGQSLAALVVALDPRRGFHCQRGVVLERASGSPRSSVPFVDAARRQRLRQRGDYDLLLFEQAAARRQWVAALRDDGFRSCRPATLHPATFVAGDCPERALEVDDWRAVVARWPRRTIHLAVHGAPGQETLAVDFGPGLPTTEVHGIDFGRLAAAPHLTYEYR